MWILAEYQPVGLFSLKLSTATSSGGKSLLVPTPYAIKMALVDAACRTQGSSRAEAMWPTLRDLSVGVRLPERAVVTNLFAKILKPRRNPAAPGSQDGGPLGKSIAFREYVWPQGSLGLVLGSLAEQQVPAMTELLLQINYLGKRGGFVQLTSPPQTIAELPDGFVLLNPKDGQQGFDSRGVMQILDDCGPRMTFEQANVYSGQSVKLGKERVLNHVVLPYQLARSSRSYSLYERIDD
jgi:hypothetical protein